MGVAVLTYPPPVPPPPPRLRARFQPPAPVLSSPAMLEPLRITADFVARSDPETLAAGKPELVEMLECAGDFIAMQGRALDKLSGRPVSIGWMVVLRRVLPWAKVRPLVMFYAGALAGSAIGARAGLLMGGSNGR